MARTPLAPRVQDPCARRLEQAGVSSGLHAASDRLGGRCWSIRGASGPGLVAEHGGELIDTGHIDIRQLAEELELATDNPTQDFQGSLQGAVFSGNRAAAEVLDAL